jgi:hypothetical protein
MSSAVLGRLDAIVDELAALEWDTFGDEEVLEVLRRVETVKRRLATVDHAALNQVEQRSLAFTHGCRTSAVLLSNLLRIGRLEAVARVRAAEALGYRRTITGAQVEPRYPLVAAAQADGAIADRHAAVIVKTIESLPDSVADEFGEFVEKTLVDQARDMDPRQLRGHASALAYALDQDGQLKDEHHREKKRGLEMHRRADGSCRVEGELTAEAGELFATVLDALTKPQNSEAGPDPRTASQRRHDAFLAMLKLVLRAQELPNVGGVTTTVVLTMDAEAWVAGHGTATTGHGYTVSAATARRWTNDGTDARFLLALLSKTKAVEAYSSTQRIFTPQQRLALIARDGGCTFPGCDAPPGYTEVHHVTEWQHCRESTLDNGLLACSFHHRHHEQLGWHAVMLDGVPHWIPPKWLGPDQVARRNTRHQRPR